MKPSTAQTLVAFDSAVANLRELIAKDGSVDAMHDDGADMVACELLGTTDNGGRLRFVLLASMGTVWQFEGADDPVNP